MNRIRRVLAIALAITILVVPSYPALAQSTASGKPVTLGAAPVTEDTEIYASMMNVSIDEALRQLELQDDIGQLNQQLSEKEPDTFAGLWIQHQPKYQVIAAFTQGGAATIQPYIQNGPLNGQVEVRTVVVSLKDLEAARSNAASVASKLHISFSSAVNVPENRSELYVLDTVQFVTALSQTGATLPSHVSLVRFQVLAKEVTNITGGVSLPTCTAGFSVRQSLTGIKGVTTAGHCSDSETYMGVNLPFMSQSYTGIHDIQWNRADQNFTVVNQMWDGASNRAITAVKFRAAQTVGLSVCKYGKTSGYGCGVIASNTQDGENIRVDNFIVSPGDSGGPWFLSNTAYGTTIASCTLGNGQPCAIYGPSDQIYNYLGITILTN